MATCGGGGDRRLRIPQVIRSIEDQITTTNINIPNDIVVEILLRLPAKSLVRFRWACKYWFDSITRDSNFAKRHAHRCSTATTTTTHGNDIFGIISPSILSTNYKNRDRNKVFQSYLNYNDTTREVVVSSQVSIALPLYGPRGFQPQIIDTCNGLILLYEPRNDNFCIWNPCTNEYKILPHSLTSEERYDIYGFGYDHTNDNYKVIRIAYDSVSSSNDVEVYTLGTTNSWRRIGSNPYRLRHLHGVFVNGVIYWMDDLEENIISFDCRTEKFRHVSQIPSLKADQYSSFWKTIHVFEGSVCMVTGKDIYSEVWVMKDYAVNNNESLWTKLSTVPYSPYGIWPLKNARNGELLIVENGVDLILCDQKNNNVKTLCRICKKSSGLQIVYIESLLSLSSGTYNGQEQRKYTNNKNNKKKIEAMETWRK